MLDLGTDSEHKDKISHNLTLYNKLKAQPSDFTDWQIVIIFLSTVHCVECYYARKGIHHFDHYNRNKAVNADFPINFAIAYDILYTISRTARYVADSHLNLKPSQVIKCENRMTAIMSWVKCT